MPPHLEDHETTLLSGEFRLQPAKKGMSLSVVLSEDVDVIANAAHSTARSHRGCPVRHLDELLYSLTLTLNRGLEHTDSKATPKETIGSHASLTPKEPMQYHYFLTAYAAWKTRLCMIEEAPAPSAPQTFSAIRAIAQHVDGTNINININV